MSPAHITEAEVPGQLESPAPTSDRIKSLRIVIPTFVTIAYSPVRSFSPRLGPFSLKNWDRTATQSGPNFFGDYM